MNRRLFEDLVVSTPAPRPRTRAAVLPVSVALHGGAIALALLVPVARQAAQETTSPLPVWEVSARRAEPSPVRVATPPRPERILPRRGTETVVPEVTALPAAVGPAAPVAEPDSLPAADSPAPCFFNCSGASPSGSGDGPTGAPTDTNGDVAGTGTEPVRPGGNIQPPQRATYVAPVFPPIAVAARVSAVVVLECTIDRNGQVTDARILRGHPLLDAAALAAVHQWRYTPTRLNGVAVPVLLTVTVRFHAQ
jgi:TonB family protein